MRPVSACQRYTCADEARGSGQVIGGRSECRGGSDGSEPAYRVLQSHRHHVVGAPVQQVQVVVVLQVGGV